MVAQTMFQVMVVCTGALATAGVALLYYRRIRLDRPAIGAFNTRDLVTLFVFIIVLPAFYLVLPVRVLTGFLVLTFASAMSITLRPVLGAAPRRLLILALIVTEIYVTYEWLGTEMGLVVYWVLTSAIVLVAAVGISNLYVQGGLRLQQVAWFSLFLAGYDAFFTMVVPLTPMLAETFEGRPLNASIGFAYNGYNANIGLGDLLVYGLFAAAAIKGFGRLGAVTALATVGLFGALVPSLVPLATAEFHIGGDGIVVPAQVFYGPAAMAAYLWLSRRTARAGARPADAPAGAVTVPAPVPVLVEA
jgi:hypothetical protein